MLTSLNVLPKMFPSGRVFLQEANTGSLAAPVYISSNREDGLSGLCMAQEEETEPWGLFDLSVVE